MIERINASDTLYAIYMYIDQDVMVTIGKLGTFPFPAGEYIYVGSAKRNITARINRHKRLTKKMHWHFDYLRPYGEITTIITYENSRNECGLYRELMDDENGSVLVNGFGSSDCRCASHLIYTGER